MQISVKSVAINIYIILRLFIAWQRAGEKIDCDKLNKI